MSFNLYGVMRPRLHPLGACSSTPTAACRDPQAADACAPTPRSAHIRMMPRPGPRRTASAWAFGRAAVAPTGRMHCVEPDPPGPARRLDRRPAPEVLRYPAAPLPLLLPDLPHDQEHGFLDLRDDGAHGLQVPTRRRGCWRTSTAARYLCQWSRLVKTVQMPTGAPWLRAGPKTSGRFRHLRQGQPQGAGASSSTATASPGCLTLTFPLIPAAAVPPLERRAAPPRTPPAIFDWPSKRVCLPRVMLPRLTYRRARHALPGVLRRRKLRHRPRKCATASTLPLPRAARPHHDQGEASS